MKVLGLVVDVDADSEQPIIYPKEIEEDLDSLYNILNCGTIDIVTRKIGGEYFDIVCDDEGLFKEKPNVSATDKDGNPMLVGNLFICRHDTQGHLASLTKEDFDIISHNITMIAAEEELYPGIIVSY